MRPFNTSELLVPNGRGRVGRTLITELQHCTPPLSHWLLPVEVGTPLAIAKNATTDTMTADLKTRANMIPFDSKRR